MVAGLLAGIHKGIADFTKTPEIALQDDEAEALVESWVEVQKFYKPRSVNPKTIAWANFATAFFAVYAKRLRDIRERKMAEKARDVTPQPKPAQQPAPGTPSAPYVVVRNDGTPATRPKFETPPSVLVNETSPIRAAADRAERAAGGRPLNPSQLSSETGALE